MTDETKDTQPTMNTIMERIEKLSDEMRAGFARIEQRLDRIEKRLDLLERQVDKLAAAMHRLDSEHDIFDERLSNLEGRSKLQ
jgi:chromosome segregation ATPase